MEECKEDCLCYDCLENAAKYKDGCCTGCDCCAEPLDKTICKCPFGWYHSD